MNKKSNLLFRGSGIIFLLLFSITTFAQSPTLPVYDVYGGSYADPIIIDNSTTTPTGSYLDLPAVNRTGGSFWANDLTAGSFLVGSNSRSCWTGTSGNGTTGPINSVRYTTTFTAPGFYKISVVDCKGNPPYSVKIVHNGSTNTVTTIAGAFLGGATSSTWKSLDNLYYFSGTTFGTEFIELVWSTLSATKLVFVDAVKFEQYNNTSSNTQLLNIECSTGASILPAFTANNTTYSLNADAVYKIKPMAASSLATVTVNGQAVTQDTYSQTINLRAKTIIVVTNGGSSTIYTINPPPPVYDVYGGTYMDEPQIIDNYPVSPTGSYLELPSINRTGGSYWANDVTAGSFLVGSNFRSCWTGTSGNGTTGPINSVRYRPTLTGSGLYKISIVDCKGNSPYSVKVVHNGTTEIVTSIAGAVIGEAISTAWKSLDNLFYFSGSTFGTEYIDLVWSSLVSTNLIRVDAVKFEKYANSSANAQLLKIEFSNGATLSPSFNSNTTAYSLTAASSYKIKPMAASSLATVTVNGQIVPVDTYSGLIYNSDITTIVVTNGNSSNTYKLIPPSRSADLVDLILDSGDSNTLSPVFNPQTNAYSINTSNSYRVKPVALDIAATITVNNQPVISGNNSQFMSNTTQAVIVVTKGLISTSYTISPSGCNADLTALSFDNGVSVTPSISPTVITYATIMNNGTFKVTPATTDPNATISINGGPFTLSGVESNSIVFNTGNHDLLLTVKSANGLYSKTYTVNAAVNQCYFYNRNYTINGIPVASLTAGATVTSDVDMILNDKTGGTVSLVAILYDSINKKAVNVNVADYVIKTGIPKTLSVSMDIPLDYSISRYSLNIYTWNTLNSMMPYTKMNGDMNQIPLNYTLGINPNDIGDCTKDYGLMLPDYNNFKEFNVRGGLPNIISKLKSGKNVTVGYIGGSITQQLGWRDRTTAWLKTQYPNANITEVNAAISGTNAKYGVSRIEKDLLVQNPDLIFVEFVVNAGWLRDLEGMVRKIWKNNPETDICFVYTLKSVEIDLFKPNGTLGAYAADFETVAKHYNIPSIFFGYVLGDLMVQNKLVSQSNAGLLDAGRIVFAQDGVHPLAPSHQLYAGAVARSIAKMDVVIQSPMQHAIINPIDIDNWEKANFYNAAELKTGNLPILINDPTIGYYNNDFQYTGNRWMIKFCFPNMVKLSNPGDTITFKFKGITMGYANAYGPFAGRLSIVVDNNPAIIQDMFKWDANNLTFGYTFLPNMTNTNHTVTIKLLAENAADRAIQKRNILYDKTKYDTNPALYLLNEAYFGKIIVVGDLSLDSMK